MKIIIGCEESQAICIAFRELGHEAFSCDLQPCSGGHPEWHFQDDIFNVLGGGQYDMGVFNPPCTFTASSGVQWLSHPEDVKLEFDKRRPHPLYPNRRDDMMKAIEFVKKIYNYPLKRIAIENPQGLLSTLWMKPTQIIQPWMFGDEATKTTCLWLKNLPPLYHNKTPNLFDAVVTHVGRGEFIEWENKKGKKKRMPKWYNDARGVDDNERRKSRSKTFPGIAKAMAEQWGLL